MQDLGSTAVPATQTPSEAAQRNHDWIRRAPARDGVERIEAFFQHNGYALHRHDTYAIGCTLAGVQSFHYRRSVRNSLPGGTMVLHDPNGVHPLANNWGDFYTRMGIDPSKAPADPRTITPGTLPPLLPRAKPAQATKCCRCSTACPNRTTRISMR